MKYTVEIEETRLFEIDELDAKSEEDAEEIAIKLYQENPDSPWCSANNCQWQQKSEKSQSE